jgi:hypothetical protein
MTQKKSGQWTKGQSGNAAGRKPGTGEVAKLRAAIAETVPHLIKMLTERALGGDVAAARLLLERAIAPLKASEEATPITMPDGTLSDQGRAVLLAVGNGALAPSQGASLLSSLGALSKLVEADELERRIEALEAYQRDGVG